MARRKQSFTGKDAKGCGCLVLLGLFIVASCQSIFAGRDRPSPTSTILPAVVTSSPSKTVDPVDDLDKDGIEDTVDDDADGDGVDWHHDIDDEDPDKGKRKSKATHKPKPEPEPEPVANAHPGGFCGDPGAVGVASNGRTYVCRGGHWRR